MKTTGGNTNQVSLKRVVNETLNVSSLSPVKPHTNAKWG